MKTRRRFDRQFKIDAVRLLETSGKTGVEVASNLGIPRDALSRWKRELNEENIRAFPGQGNPRDEELARLRKENADIRMERDILKKAVAIFSKPENRSSNS
jgi:transposase-like protein